MNSITVLGHKSPDTDSICSAIAYAELKNKIGIAAEPARLGAINAETRFVLSYFHTPEPRLVETLSGVATQVILVDHNERQQSASDIDQISVIEVIDHHRIANFETSDPIYYRAEPVGCTATIIFKMFAENHITIEKNMAGLLVSAIISDTLLLTSPTSTKEDIEAAHVLAPIAEVNLEEYGLQMLKAGANVRNQSSAELISLDAKDFQIGPSKVKISQVNVVDPNDLLSRQQELENLMRNAIAEEGLDLFLLLITDILQHDSVMLALGNATYIVEQGFHVTLVDHCATLKGVVSRKKQVVPILDLFRTLEHDS